MKTSSKMRWMIALSIPLFFIVFSFIAGSQVFGKGLNIPRIIVIKHIQKKYSPVKFDHSAHISLASGCGQCHHIHNDKQNATCKECHAMNSASFKATVKEGFLPCSACHTDSSADSPEIPGLKVALHKKCFQCHIGIEGLGVSPQGCIRTCHTRNN